VQFSWALWKYLQHSCRPGWMVGSSSLPENCLRLMVSDQRCTVEQSTRRQEQKIRNTLKRYKTQDMTNHTLPVKASPLTTSLHWPNSLLSQGLFTVTFLSPLKTRVHWPPRWGTWAAEQRSGSFPDSSRPPCCTLSRHRARGTAPAA